MILSMLKLKMHREIFFLLIASIVAMVLAYIVELSGYLPCKLCYYQRYLYYAIAGVSCFALLIKRKLFIFLILFFLIIAEFSVAVFHIGVEAKVFTYDSECATEILPNLLVEDVSAILSDKSKIVRCDEPQFIAYGLSMTVWNAIYILFVGIIFIYLSYANKKTSH